MSWFENITGFHEEPYKETRSKLKVQNGRLTSLVNGRSFQTGRLELTALSKLRKRVKSESIPAGRIKVSVVKGDVRLMHQAPENNGALFQVASQFNLLEMISPDTTPEHGVTRYQSDPTQGPACAIAAGAATIYRNYFAQIDGDEGQTEERQLNGLADIGIDLSRSTRLPVGDLWEMRNGYALAKQTGLETITNHLKSISEEDIDRLREKLKIGLHSDVEVTEATGPNIPLVSQAFCSALPVAYSSIPKAHWEALSVLVLEAAYEATMWAAVLNAQRGASNVVLLTLLGGGAFGNRTTWIYAAIRRALKLVSHFNIEVKLVSFNAPSDQMQELVQEFQ
jgi:hypothetical protein